MKINTKNAQGGCDAERAVEAHGVGMNDEGGSRGGR